MRTLLFWRMLPTMARMPRALRSSAGPVAPGPRNVANTRKATIQARSFSLLDEVAKVLNDNKQIKLVEVQGHTDNRGNDDFNLKLSDARARAVYTYLIGKGVDPSRLTAQGYGETRPIGDNNTSIGREANRRVEFVILKQDVPE